MLWIKALHLIFMVTWFSGLFYLPRLYVYHAMSTDSISITRFKIMERKLYYGITTPGAVFTLLFGGWLISFNPHYYLAMPWFHFKLSIVLLVIIYHLYLGKILKAFARDQNKHSSFFYRILNEIPVIFLVGIVLLVVVRPNLSFHF